jgi:hypothetical protein
MDAQEQATLRRVIAALDAAIEELPEASGWIWAFDQIADKIELVCDPVEDEAPRVGGSVRRGHLSLVD